MTDKPINPAKTEYFSSLTGIRAIAAFMVFIHHYNPFSSQNNVIFNFTQEFHTGVTIFFVLSGFLIAYRYSDMNNFNFKKYMVNRIARIYPMYFILTAATFIVFKFSPAHQSENLINLFLLNISFMRGFFDPLKFSGIAQGWSLTVEETFYLLAPLFFILIKRSKYFLILLPILMLMTGLILVSVFSNMNCKGFFQNHEFMFNYTFFGRCFEFFTGIALAIVFKRNWKLNFKHFTYTGILGIAISILLISLQKGDFDFGIRTAEGKILNTLIMPMVGISSLFYGLITEETIVSKFLSSKLMVLLGKSSYIFYLIHIGVISSLINHFSQNLFILFVVVNLISIALFKTIEEPLNNYIRKQFA
jgi:peptidoglycan/LPS O-acetylase OafA/YrhL